MKTIYPLSTNSNITYFLKNEIQDYFEQEQDDLDDLIEIPIEKRIKVKFKSVKITKLKFIS